MRGSWSYRSMLLVAGCALAVGLWARINNLGSPSSRVFDETCFSAFAYNYLQGLPVFDLHTPLGKFVLAAVIALLGDTRLAWRLMPALFGCALLIVGAVFGWCYTKERAGALLLAAFVASERTLVVSLARVFRMASFCSSYWQPCLRLCTPSERSKLSGRPYCLVSPSASIGRHSGW